MKYRKINNIFFVGIGGIGMSGIAELLHEQGLTYQDRIYMKMKM